MKHILVAGAILALATTFEIDRIALSPVEALAQASEAVTQLRAALGGDRKLDAVTALSVEGSFRRVMGPREMEGVLEIILLRDGRMRRTEDLSLAGMTGGPTIERVTTLSGDRAWDESNSRGGMGGGMFMMRMGEGPGAPGGGANDPNRPRPSPEDIEKARGRMMKQEYDRWMFALLAASDRPIAHVGTAEAPDGTADVLEIKDERDQPVRLFVDRKTGLPLMLTYQTVRPRMMMRGAGGQGGQSGQRPDPEEMRRRMQAEGPPPPATATMRFAEHKAVNGLTLPHRITVSIGDEPTEEWVIEKYKINPSVKAGLFEKK